MNGNQKYTPAFNVITEFAVNHQELQKQKPFLEKIALHYDNFFKSTFFTTNVNELEQFYINKNQEEIDSLFLLDEQIPFLLKTKQVNSQECIEIFSIIYYWHIHFNLPMDSFFLKLSQLMGIPVHTYRNIKEFFSNNFSTDHNNIIQIQPDQYDNQSDILEGNWVDLNKPDSLQSEEHLKVPGIEKELTILNLAEYNAFLVKCEEHTSRIKKNQKDYPDNFCFLSNNDYICIENGKLISYNNIKQLFIDREFGHKFIFSVQNASLKNKYGSRLHPVSFTATPGQLIGVIGNEGVGKSSLLRLLSGTVLPYSGGVYLNTYNIHRYKYQLAGILGYVPEEDLLFDDLTCYENIDYIASLHFGMLSKQERADKVSLIIKDLNLQNIAGIRVGRQQEKIIRPGQRRLLNIALELIRDPEILFIDNAQSGLNLREASEIIELLSKLTFKGKLIITAITQTTEKSFSNFDNIIVINKNNYPLYYGQPSNIFNYFSEHIGSTDLFSTEAQRQMNSETILDFIEEKVIDIANTISPHKVTEDQLHSNYLEASQKDLLKYNSTNKLPGNIHPHPRLETQFIAYTYRNFRTKIAEKKELYYNIIISPIVAILLALIFRINQGGDYLFYENENILNFFYTSIIASFFIGLIQSAREITSENHLIKRDERLNLSLFSLINSKVIYLFSILAIQTFLYTLAGNSILEIKGMLWSHWVIYFSCAASGSFIGLVFSSSHKIYESILIKTIPITLLLFTLFGGGWIQLNKLKINKNQYPPVISNIIPSRWAYEAIVVRQFKANPYQKIFFEVNNEISTGSFNSYQMIPLLNSYLDYIEENKESKQDTCATLLIALQNRLNYYNATEDIYPFEYTNELSLKAINDFMISEIRDYLNYVAYYYDGKYKNALKQKDFLEDSLAQSFDEYYLERLYIKSSNQKLNKTVRQSLERKPISVLDHNLVQNTDIIYQSPFNNLGRAPFFSSQKRFNNQIIPTFLFNLSVIWIINLLLYVMLITNFPSKINKNRY